jgi:hypothetical protein
MGGRKEGGREGRRKEERRILIYEWLHELE